MKSSLIIFLERFLINSFWIIANHRLTINQDRVTPHCIFDTFGFLVFLNLKSLFLESLSSLMFVPEVSRISCLKYFKMVQRNNSDLLYCQSQTVQKISKHFATFFVFSRFCRFNCSKNEDVIFLNSNQYFYFLAFGILWDFLDFDKSFCY